MRRTKIIGRREGGERERERERERENFVKKIQIFYIVLIFVLFIVLYNF